MKNYVKDFEQIRREYLKAHTFDEFVAVAYKFLDFAKTDIDCNTARVALQYSKSAIDLAKKQCKNI